MQILLYDDNEMHVYDIVNYNQKSPDVDEIDATSIEDMFTHKVIVPKGTYSAEITVGEKKAELDPTTMKRIAKYNLDKEFWEINEKINKATDKLMQLNKEVDQMRSKIELIDNLAVKIWEDEDFDEDNYLPDDEEDSEDDEWEDDWE